MHQLNKTDYFDIKEQKNRNKKISDFCPVIVMTQSHLANLSTFSIL